METPVLLITFNRPQYTKEVLASLKAANVKNLYVFKDGPRPFNNDDKKNSKEIEKLISNIDWECNVTTNYMNNNLGCGWGPFSAISWAFQYVDRLIILEDDCVPTKSFFEYCTYLLEKYKDEPKVQRLSGRCLYSEHPIFDKYDYLFTQYAPTQGWATWRRVWDNFSLNERFEIKPFFERGGYTNQYCSKEENKYNNDAYYNRRAPLKDMLHAWDYQFAVHSRISGALSICPSKNLIQYIGFEGTHKTQAIQYEVKACENYTITKEPKNICMIPEFEAYVFKRRKNSSIKYKLKTILNKIRYKIFGRPDF